VTAVNVDIKTDDVLAVVVADHEKRIYDEINHMPISSIEAMLRKDYTKNYLISNTLIFLQLFEIYFGENSYRRVPEFQELLEIWRERYNGCQKLDHEPFVRWMNKESRILKPPMRKLRKPKMKVNILDKDGQLI